MNKILVFLPCLLVLCSSCTDDSDRPWYQDVEALESCYLAAVRDAEEALPQEICHTLPAIVSPKCNLSHQSCDERYKGNGEAWRISCNISW